MSRFVKRVLTTATVAALALTAAGFTGAGAATVASRATGPAIYSDQLAGYQATGRWFRYGATTVTVPPRTLPNPNSGSPLHRAERQVPGMDQRGPRRGPDSVGYEDFGVGTGPFGLAPRGGDRLAINVYYDQRGHTFFTVTDLTRPATQTVVQLHRPADLHGGPPVVQTDRVLSVSPPAADTRL